MFLLDTPSFGLYITQYNVFVLPVQRLCTGSITGSTLHECSAFFFQFLWLVEEKEVSLSQLLQTKNLNVVNKLFIELEKRHQCKRF